VEGNPLFNNIIGKKSRRILRSARRKRGQEFWEPTEGTTEESVPLLIGPMYVGRGGPRAGRSLRHPGKRSNYCEESRSKPETGALRGGGVISVGKKKKRDRVCGNSASVVKRERSGRHKKREATKILGRS